MWKKKFLKNILQTALYNSEVRVAINPVRKKNRLAMKDSFMTELVYLSERLFQ